MPQTVPANLAFAPCQVPGSPAPLGKGKFGMWYRTKFRLPPWMPAKDLYLTLRVGTEGTVFINGQRVGSYFGRMAGGCDCGPVEVSQAEMAKGLIKADGDNELVICVRARSRR